MTAIEQVSGLEYQQYHWENRRDGVKRCQKPDFAILAIVGMEDDIKVGNVTDRIYVMVMWQRQGAERRVYLEEKEFNF